MKRRIITIILTEKNKMKGITLPNIKLYYNTTLIKTVWYWQQDRYTDQWNKTENPEMYTHNYAQLTFDKDAKTTQ